MFKTILVATDGSAHGSRALGIAQEMATGGDHRLVIVHVVQLVGGKGGMFPLLADEQSVHQDLVREVETLRSAGIETELLTPQARMTSPAHAIAEAAVALGADLIVVGRRGQSLVGEVILGGVPIRLMQIAHCPVLVVPGEHAAAA
jgi:nucleotide-binding universal stress UspA family protein